MAVESQTIMTWTCDLCRARSTEPLPLLTLNGDHAGVHVCPSCERRPISDLLGPMRQAEADLLASRARLPEP